MQKILTIVIIVCLFVSCNIKLTDQQLMARFYSYKPLFDSLLTSIKSNNKLDSLFQIGPERGLPDIQNSYPTEYSLLKKLGITDASSHANVCRTIRRWYYLKTNWPSDCPIYFIYDFTGYCNDSSESIKGFYKKDEGENETWGLGNHWSMFRLVKEIRIKQ